MKILVVAATQNEINETRLNFKSIPTIEFLVTGVGMTLTAYELTKYMCKQHFDLIINAGIAGSFHPELKIGQVTAVEYDFFAELGAENNNDFIPFSEMNLMGVYDFQNRSLITSKTYHGLKKVKAATINKVHGNENSIQDFLSIHPVDIESMEGAAVAMVCEKENIPYIQLRSISNYVTKRDLSKWNIPLAITNLNQILSLILNEIAMCQTN